MYCGRSHIGEEDRSALKILFENKSPYIKCRHLLCVIHVWLWSISIVRNSIRNGKCNKRIDCALGECEGMCDNGDDDVDNGQRNGNGHKNGEEEEWNTQKKTKRETMRWLSGCNADKRLRQWMLNGFGELLNIQYTQSLRLMLELMQGEEGVVVFASIRGALINSLPLCK